MRYAKTIIPGIGLITVLILAAVRAPAEILIPPIKPIKLHRTSANKKGINIYHYPQKCNVDNPCAISGQIKSPADAAGLSLFCDIFRRLGKRLIFFGS